MAYALPSSLKHILEVYRLIRQARHCRIEAINEVAMKERIDPQTVRSSCTRSIGINISEFDDFVLVENLASFEEHLINRFPNYQDDIENFFDEITGRQPEIKGDDPVRKLKALFPEEKRNLLKSVLLDKMQEDFNSWSYRNDIPDDIKQQLKKWTELIKKV
jgi:hypothetical protein